MPPPRSILVLSGRYPILSNASASVNTGTLRSISHHVQCLRLGQYWYSQVDIPSCPMPPPRSILVLSGRYPIMSNASASVNIGTLRLISHHVQCLNSQQLFYYIISLNKKKSKKKNKILAMDYVLDSFDFFLYDDYITSCPMPQ